MIIPQVRVEHVCPQTMKPEGQWNRWFNNPQVHSHWLHRAANLVLLARRKNSTASNWDFETKKKVYFTRDDACPFLLTRQVLDKEEWTPAVLEERQTDVLRSLAKSWEIERQFEDWQRAGR